VPAPSVRVVTDDEFGRFVNVVYAAFVLAPTSDDQVAAHRQAADLDRCHGAFDGEGRLCGAARTFATQLTVPGGEVAAGAVTSVGVLPTHRRQGHLSRLMQAQLADVADRGEPVAILVAAEYPIYGRYGYGPATEACGLRVDARAARWRAPASGTVDLVDNETFAKAVDDLYDRARRQTPGHVAWEPVRWRVHAGVESWPDGDDAKRREATKVVWRDADGEVQAATSYRVDGVWQRNRPAGKLSADPLVATSGPAESELLRFLASIDWVAEVSTGLRPIDDPAPLTLLDGRTANLVDRSDHLWLRVLDVATALTARRYAAPGTLVIEVDDPLGFAAGRFRLEAGPDGAECRATTAAPDLRVPAGALGAAYLGGVSWARLTAAGWVDERSDGAVDRATALFATPRAPWCAMTF
jgi:predicted acetyltransferase